MTPLETLVFVTATVTAFVGTFVAYQAYRGYRRNGSERMRSLAIGIVFIAVIPTLAIYLGDGPVFGSDAQALLFVLGSHAAGLLAIYHSLD